MSVRIVVVGSINVDLVTGCERFPQAGESLEANAFSIKPGGKGANQAVACARMGARAALIGAVGQDAFVEVALAQLKAGGVDLAAVRRCGEPTGTATILLDAASENTILIHRGANNRVTPDWLDTHAETIRSAAGMLVQLETPLPSVERAIRLAHEAGVPILLDPAPAGPVPDALLALVDLITPNRQETITLTGIDPTGVAEAFRAADALRARGARQAVVKLGAEGCVLVNDTLRQHLPGTRVDAVDTVGAGDCFAGALMTRWLECRDLVEAARFANVAASIKVGRHGAQGGIPTRAEVDAALR